MTDMTVTIDLIAQALEAANRLEQMKRISLPEVVHLIRRLACRINEQTHEIEELVKQLTEQLERETP